MTDLVYGRAAPIYRQHGWAGVLPLPEGQKAHPPSGFTGATGADPTDAQVLAWCEDLPNGNIALRLPEGVIGIDIDAYLDKHGDVSLLALEATLGTLPATWRSTSREVLRKSGIYLFRVPAGRYHDKPAPNIEVIQHHHRYVVVMPSIHPEGRPYFWYDATDTEQRRPPRIEELAVLPEAWVEHLREKPRAEGEREHRHHAVDDWTPAVTKAFTRALMEMSGGRHDATLTAVMALARLDRLEHPGAAAAMGELGQRFRAAITDRSTPKQADKEWADMVDGAYEIADSTPATAPKWDATWKPGASAYGPDWQWWEDKPPPNPDDPYEGLSGRLLFDHNFWTRNRDGEQWLVEPILALGRSHALYAPAKAGKSLLALEIAAAIASGRYLFNQPPGPPRTVLYADFEMTEDDIYERLCDLGYGEDDDLSRFHYHLHPVMPALDTVQGGTAFVAHAIHIAAELVVVDTVARTISGEENSSDTIIALARYTFTPLKARGITTVRVDHAGKDLAKGQRGTSAKNDDVDVVWQLTVADGEAVTLRATHRRLSWVPEQVSLNRQIDPLRHLLTDHVWPAGTGECARRLEHLGDPATMTARQAQELLKAAGWGTRKAIVVAALRFVTTGTATGTAKTPKPEPPREPSNADPSDLREPLREPPGTANPSDGNRGVPYKGTTGSGPQPDLTRWQTEEF